MELAGAIAEVVRMALAEEFDLDPTMARERLIEGQPRLLAALPEGLSAHAKQKLRAPEVAVRGWLAS